MAKAWNKIDWNEDRVNFLKKNWKTKTNKELADAGYQTFLRFRL